MKRLACVRSTLSLACLLSISHRTQAQDAPTPTTIPLDVIVEPDGTRSYERLGINIGVNGAAPREYIFDTGSTEFNIAVGPGAKSQPWFPFLPGVAVHWAKPAEYGDGSYGNLAKSTTVGSFQFYRRGDQAPSASFLTPQGMPVTLNTGTYATDDSMEPGHERGRLVGYWTAESSFLFSSGMHTLEEIDFYGLTPEDLMDWGDFFPVYIDATAQQQLDQGMGPLDGGGYDLFGIFGAGDFGGDSVLGNLTKSGYIVAANAQVGKPQNCTGCEHVILNLTPALRAQFISQVPWSEGSAGVSPLSGAPVSASQFDLAFAYTLDGGKYTVTLPTLLDSGTGEIFLNDADLLKNAAGHIDADHFIAPGGTLTMTGVATGAQPTSVQTGSIYEGDQSNVVVAGSNPYIEPGTALYGISFYFNNSVMYDLENKLTGYTPFFVSIDPISTDAKGYSVTDSMAPQGIAGIISGKGPFEVAASGKAQLTGANTYTGATLIDKNGWLGLAGPGSIATSSGVRADGIFDISRSAGPVFVQSLDGAGTVALGGNTLELTRANGSFGGRLIDGGLGGGAGGGVIVAGGRQTLTGENTFTGRVGIGPQGLLDLRGSVAGSVLDAGVLTGGGHVGGDLTVSGLVAPGSSTGMHQNLAVDGSYRQLAGSTFATQLDTAGHASQITVKGGATLDTGARLGILAASPARDALYTRGTRYTVLTSAQNLAGSYAVAATPVSAMLALAPAYDARHAYLDVVQTRPLPAAAQTPNQQATLAGVQSLAASSPVFASVANLPTDPSIRRAADTLSGEVYSGTSAIQLDDSHLIRDAVNARLATTRRQDSVAGGASKAAGDDSTTRTQSNGVTTWGQFVGSWGRRDGDGNAARLTDTTNGFMVGADLSLGETARLGVVGGHTHTSLLSPYSRKNIGNAEFAGLYGGTALGAWYLQGGAAYTAQTQTVNRSAMLFSGIEGVWSRHDASTSQAFAEAGYTLELKSLKLEPFAQAAYVQLRNDGFKETGGNAALTVRGGRDAVTYSTLGAHLSTQVRSRRSAFTFYGTLGWRHASGAVHPSSAMHFAGGNDFTVAGVPIARRTWIADAGAAMQVDKNLSFNLNYTGQIAGHALDSGFKMGAMWRL